jgi:predicted nucleic acid-binding protein
MQKIVIDTNVLVSSLIQRSYPYLIIYDLFTFPSYKETKIVTPKEYWEMYRPE